MATIQKRKNKNSTISYKVMIRTKDGLPTSYKTFPTLQEAKDWALQEEAFRRQQIYFPERAKNRHTVAELIDCYLDTILPSKPKNAKDTMRQLAWWKEKIGQYSLMLITPDLIATYRKELREGVTNKGTKRTPATVNRYLAAMSTVLSYGVKEKGWISVNPMTRVTKLKEPRGRDRVISKDDKIRACYQHACLQWVSGTQMTNTSLRNRLAIKDSNYPIASRIIKDSIKNGLLKPYGDQAKKTAKYVPFWA